MAERRKTAKAQMASPETAVPIVTCEELARVAYELYLQRGRVDGHDLEDWLKAEAMLRQRNGRASRR